MSSTRLTPKSGDATPRSRSLLGSTTSSRVDQQQAESPSTPPGEGGPAGSLQKAGKTPRSASRSADRPWRDTAPTPAPRSTPRRPPSASTLTARAAAGAARHGPLSTSPSMRSVQDAMAAAEGTSEGMSAHGSDDLGSIAGDDEYWAFDPREGDNVRVVIRMRPANATETADPSHFMCAATPNTREVLITLPGRDPYHFAFDDVLPEETEQGEVFETVGAPVVDNCLSGFNSSIFAYGQTGAGKTYTMTGRIGNGNSALDAAAREQLGLAPRVFEYLFERIEGMQDQQGRDRLKFHCRCSMLEIYNEVITDLLNPAATNLQIREDIKRGCYVEGLSEEIVQNVEDAMRVLRRGAENRHVGETRLNRESSRSHSVFTCVIERNSRESVPADDDAAGGSGGEAAAPAAGGGRGAAGGKGKKGDKVEGELTKVVFSRLNLIDLAGSERIRSGAHGGSGAQGEHFKEACHINKSLTTLGRVINELVRSQQAERKKGAPPVHIPYRDSRLTFLLQDSLGGNAKTMIVANVSPSSVCAQETLSTLYFARRAKHIRNRATVNVDVRGDVTLLQREIQRLNTELDNLRKGLTEPVVQECRRLRQQLASESAARQELSSRLEVASNDNAQLRRERKRMDEKLAHVHGMAGDLTGLLMRLSARMARYEAADETARAAQRQAAETELRIEAARLAAATVAAARQQDGGAAAAAAAEVAALKGRLAAAEERERAAQDEARGVEASAAALRQQLSAARQAGREADARCRGAEERAEAAEDSQAQEAAARAAGDKLLVEAREELRHLSGWLEQQREESEALRRQLEDTQAQGETRLRAESDALSQQLEEAEGRLGAVGRELEAARCKVEAAEREVDALTRQLAAAEEAVGDGSEALEAMRAVNADLESQVVQWEAQMAAARAELEAAHHALTAATQRADDAVAARADAEAARDAAANEGRWLRVKLANESEGRTAVEGRAAAVEEELRDKASTIQRLQADLQAVRSTAAAKAHEAAVSEKELSNRLMEADAEMHNLRAAVASLEERGRQLEGQVAARDAAAAERQGDNKALQEEVHELAERLQALDRDREQLQARLAAAHTDKEQLQSALEEQRAASSDAAHRLAGANESLAAATALADEREKELAALRRAAEGQVERHEEAAREAAAKMSQLQRDLVHSQDTLAARDTELARVRQEVVATKDKLERKRADLTAAREDLVSERGLLAAQEATARDREALLADLKRAKAAATAELDGLRRQSGQQLGELQQRLSDLIGKNSDLEVGSKESMLANARHAKALSEIKRLVEWAADDPRGSHAFNPGRLAQAMRAAAAAAGSSSRSGGGSDSLSGSSRSVSGGSGARLLRRRLTGRRSQDIEEEEEEEQDSQEEEEEEDDDGAVYSRRHSAAGSGAVNGPRAARALSPAASDAASDVSSLSGPEAEGEAESAVALGLVPGGRDTARTVSPPHDPGQQYSRRHGRNLAAGLAAGLAAAVKQHLPSANAHPNQQQQPAQQQRARGRWGDNMGDEVHADSKGGIGGGVGGLTGGPAAVNQHLSQLMMHGRRLAVPLTSDYHEPLSDDDDDDEAEEAEEEQEAAVAAMGGGYLRSGGRGVGVREAAAAYQAATSGGVGGRGVHPAAALPAAAVRPRLLQRGDSLNGSDQSFAGTGGQYY